MDQNEKTFLATLAADEDDEVVRVVYADWLEEQGRPEEAERQRNWRSAKLWIAYFVVNNNEDPDDPEPYYRRIGYDELMEMARHAYEEGTYHIHLGDNMSMTDALRSEGSQFWRNWSIVTGIRIPEDMEGSYRCGC